MRELRNKYETNRHIKTWSCWFLLKALTSSSKIQTWYKQKEHLFPWLQLNENTFRRRIAEMEKLELLTIDNGGSLNLVSYEKAAGILGIAWCGLTNIIYNPTKNAGKQIFQYLLRGEEIRLNQDIQLDALTYHLEKNLSLKIQLHYLMVKAGADDQRLHKEPRYFQERLLLLQMHLFKEGSELLEFVTTHRADINRGVLSIKKAHCYKATQSVSYMKKRMRELKLISIEKKCVRSLGRSRLFIPDGNGKKKDGYKWIARTKQTALFLTDQISFLYEIKPQKKRPDKAAVAA